MTFRPGPLRAAAVLAAGFVVVRVVYRVLFHGADGDGVVLLPLPELRLPPPFAHVVTLGPVTTDGLWDAAASALPIAFGILAFGLVNSLVDIARLFARASRRGPLRGVARALAIAWATLPSLADGARAVRFARRLRGERGGVRMLMPLLQRTLERAGNVAAALELRGFAGRRLDGDCRMAVDAHDVELGFGGTVPSPSPGVVPAAPPLAAEASSGASGGGGPHGSLRAWGRVGPAAAAVRVRSLLLEPGSLTVLSGPTGSGKSTLLRAIAGLHQHVDGGWAVGSLRVVGHDRGAVPPRDLAQRVGVVLQHPRDAFATERVREEIGLPLDLRGVAPAIVAARVDEVAARVGVGALLDRPTRGLSAGEATLVAIAAAIVEQPILLLVDEPLADLDAGARNRVAGLLDRLAHQAGMCVLVAEHRTESLAPLADRWLRIDEANVVEVPTPAASVARVEASKARDSTEERRFPVLSRVLDVPAASRRTVLRATEVTVRHRGVVAVDAATLELFAGEVVALVGPNGAGKSSLLAVLALPPRDAAIEAPGRVALVPDASDDLFVYDTVAAECRSADRRAAKTLRAPSGEDIRPGADRSAGSGPHLGDSPRGGPSLKRGTAARFAGFLGLDPDGSVLAERLARHPRDLSVGERRCLALAIQLAGDPAVLLVDEPTRGLDPAARAVVWQALRGLADAGTSVLVTSHEPEVTALGDRTLRMERGMLSAAGREVGGKTAGTLAVPATAPATSPAAAPAAEPATAPAAGPAAAPTTPATSPAEPAAFPAAEPATAPAAIQDGWATGTPMPRNLAVAGSKHPELRTWPPARRTPADSIHQPDSSYPPEREHRGRGRAAASVSATQDERTHALSIPRRLGIRGAGSANRPELRTGSTPLRERAGRKRATDRLLPVALGAANLVVLAAFCWPLVASAVPAQAYAAVPVAALALAPLAGLVVVATLDETVRSAHMLALLGTLAAIGAAVRVASTGVGGVEAVFILLILAGRAFGARFGLLLGIATIALSTLVTGTFGPWTPFQMFACAWVGAGAGLLPRRLGPRAEIAMLCVYGVVASYAFGMLMNLWFWPFAVGYGTGISYEPGGAIGTNLSNFLLYSLVTSTLTWDTLRAITSVIGIVVIGRPVLAALRRAKPLRISVPARAAASVRAVALQP